MAILEPIAPGGLQPGIGAGGPGGAGLGNIPGYSTGGAVPPATNALPRISYNGKAIDFPRFSVWRWQAEPNPLHTFDLAEDGRSRTTLYNRMDIPVRGSFKVIDNNPNMRADLYNFWQWACRGYGWFISLDATQVINTTLIANSSGNTITVSDATGFAAGRIIKLIYAYGYALATVQSVSGSTITLTNSLDVTFPAGTKVRDQHFYRCVIWDANAPCPIIDTGPADNMPQSFPQGWFTMELSFYEDCVS